MLICFHNDLVGLRLNYAYERCIIMKGVDLTRECMLTFGLKLCCGLGDSCERGKRDECGEL